MNTIFGQGLPKLPSQTFRPQRFGYSRVLRSTELPESCHDIFWVFREDNLKGNTVSRGQLLHSLSIVINDTFVNLKELVSFPKIQKEVLHGSDLKSSGDDLVDDVARPGEGVGPDDTAGGVLDPGQVASGRGGQGGGQEAGGGEEVVNVVLGLLIRDKILTSITDRLLPADWQSRTPTSCGPD